jgi:tetratricopeptide (TPR) repeat protein
MLAEGAADRATNGASGRNGRRLIGWKAIGQFLYCTERTARRWEAYRGLPVHRIPGGNRSPVWASPDELSQWLKALPSEVQESLRAEALTESPAEADLPAAERPVRVRRLGPGSWLIAALALVALGILGTLEWKSLVGLRGLAHSSQTAYDDDPQAREIYRTARFEVSTRTAEGLTAAQRSFRQLVDRYPERAAGWAGLADTYLLLREFGPMSDEAAYPQAARAARTAVALDPKLAEGWLDEAFVSWWWQGDSAGAFRAFAIALRLDPTSARAFHWHATALYAHGEYDKALQAIARARALDPDNRAILADEAWMRFGTGRRTEGLATLERLAQIDPQFVSWHYYLAHAYLIQQRDADFLREARAAAGLRGQPEVIAALRLAEQRLKDAGPQAMLDQLSAEEAERWTHGAGSAVVVAEYRALAGDRAGMLKWLAAAEAGHDHNLPAIRGYPEFSAYLDDPAFQQILKRLS